MVYKLSDFAKLTGVSKSKVRYWRLHNIISGHQLDGYHYFYTDDDYKLFLHLKKTNPDILFRKKVFKYKDLKGLRFGKLVVIKRTNDTFAKNGHRIIQWLCKCDCGNSIVVTGASLQSGYRKSCGCLLKGTSDTMKMRQNFNTLKKDHFQDLLNTYNVDSSEFIKKSKQLVNQHKAKRQSHLLQDLTGKTFGFWTVLHRGRTRYYKHGGQAVCWVCRCKCGTIKTVPGRDLKSGASKSCGCMTKMSWLEFYTKSYLLEHGYTAIYQKSFSKLHGLGGRPLVYDFWITYPIKCLIECQGEQHYRPVRKFGGADKLLVQTVHDYFKQKFANETLRVPLLYVPYFLKTKSDIYTFLDEILKNVKASKNSNSH